MIRAKEEKAKMIEERDKLARTGDLAKRVDSDKQSRSKENSSEFDKLLSREKHRQEKHENADGAKESSSRDRKKSKKKRSRSRERSSKKSSRSNEKKSKHRSRSRSRERKKHKERRQSRSRSTDKNSLR